MKMELFVIVVLFCSVGYAQQTTDDELRTFHMHEQCGAKISLKRESIFAAKIELRPSEIVAKPDVVIGELITATDEPLVEHKGSSGIECEFQIESWDFQDRLMVNVDELELGDGADCSRNMEILDGPDEQSNQLTGLPVTICSFHTKKLVSRSFVTSDKHLTIRFHGDVKNHTRIIFRATIVAFSSGPCRSYEYQCQNTRCIMPDLVCLGHNPCGDNSDCTQPEPTIEVATAETPDYTIVVRAASLAGTGVVVIIVVVVAIVCYRRRHKDTSHHQHFRQLSQISEATTIQRQESSSQRVDLERSVSQIERDKQFAPPSYSTLPQCCREPQIMEEVEESNDSEADELSNCLEPDDNNPPSYACVLKHQEEFHVSQTSLPQEEFHVSQTSLPQVTFEGGDT